MENEESDLLEETLDIRRKPNVAVLNKRKISKYELDELFASD